MKLTVAHLQWPITHKIRAADFESIPGRDPGNLSSNNREPVSQAAKNLVLILLGKAAA
jgi:hypothetical protein